MFHACGGVAWGVVCVGGPQCTTHAGVHEPVNMGGKGGGRIGRCGLHAHEQGGEADKGGCRGAGIGAPGARHVGEHVVVRALEGDAPLFVVAEFFSLIPL